MGWIQACMKTYDNNIGMAGKITENNDTLMPLYFMLNKAQIEITVTENGEFVGARELSDKNEQYTAIPVTEDSASRSGKAVFPHPLCDQLQYICFGEDKCPLKNADYEKKHTAYMKGLRAWAESADSHPKVRAVLKYLDNGNMYSDLVSAKLITGADNKIGGTEPEKCLVRWRVLSTGDINIPTGVWEDETLYESYARYYSSARTGEGVGVCYATGEMLTLTSKHPKGIVKSGYGAKLISSNDNVNFTYRGRFINSEEAATVSETASQKAHSALRWVAANQGVIRGGRTFVCWCPEGKKPPVIVDDIFADDAEDSSDEPEPGTMPEYRRRLSGILNGYKNRFSENDSIVLMILDAATTGRLSVTYYNEYYPSDFFDRIDKWYTGLCWYTLKFKDKKPYYALRCPACQDIVNLAFGTERKITIKGKEIYKVEADDRVFAEQLQRIIHCMVDGQPLPYDIVLLLTERASMPQAYSNGNYEKLLTAACAAVRKYYNEKHENEVWKMALDRQCKNRSYLFGRLLAVCEKAEQAALYGTDDKDRETNAMRYQTAFVQRPMHTWNVLEKALNPYYAKLKTGSMIYYKNEISEIVGGLSECNEKELNQPLEAAYLLGYYLERLELNTKTPKSEEN